MSAPPEPSQELTTAAPKNEERNTNSRGQPPPASWQAQAQPGVRPLRYKDRFHTLREQYEQVLAAREAHKRALQMAKEKERRMQDEVDMLLDLAMMTAPPHEFAPGEHPHQHHPPPPPPVAAAQPYAYAEHYPYPPPRPVHGQHHYPHPHSQPHQREPYVNGHAHPHAHAHALANGNGVPHANGNGNGHAHHAREGWQSPVEGSAGRLGTE